MFSTPPSPSLIPLNYSQDNLLRRMADYIFQRDLVFYAYLIAYFWLEIVSLVMVSLYLEIRIYGTVHLQSMLFFSLGGDVVG